MNPTFRSVGHNSYIPEQKVGHLNNRRNRLWFFEDFLQETLETLNNVNKCFHSTTNIHKIQKFHRGKNSDVYHKYFIF